MEECLFIILTLAVLALPMIAFGITIIIFLIQIKGRLKTIMETQAEFDAKIEAANAALADIAEAIRAEAEQIAAFIASHPGINTSALDGIVTHLQSVSASIGNVFEPTPGGSPEETEENEA